MFLIIGALTVFGSVAVGYSMHGGEFAVLYQPSEAVIIGGAAIGALLIGTPVPILKNLVGQLRAFFSSGIPKADYLDLLGMLYQLFKVAQQSGIMALEAHFEDVSKSAIMSRYPRFLGRHHAVDFLADSVKVIIIGGITAHDLEALMDQDLEVHHEEELKPSATLNKMGDSLPGLGIVAAVLGVVITMGAIAGPPS
jgi:chemotaxis protein MotA